MTRFALGFAAALLAILLAPLVFPIDMSVRLSSAANVKSMVPEIVVPLTEWCVGAAPAVIARSGLNVEVAEVLRNSNHYPFVTSVVTIPTAENSVTSPESSKKAFNLANELMRTCLPKTHLTLRGDDVLGRAIDSLRDISAHTDAGETYWVVLEFDPAEKRVTLSRMPGDIGNDSHK